MTGLEALIPRDLRAEVPERIDAVGRFLTPLDEAAVRREVHRLRERGTEALAIHFIHAYANPAHEQRCAEIAREIWPNRFVTLGSDILREVREFERGSTAALNGYVQPIVSRYLGRLSQNLRSAGLSNKLLVMQGNAATDGWGFADFTDLKPGSEALHKTCFPCHAPAKDRDFVFTHYAP
jgi:N-methylhydantoinase A